jgi:serine/threonine protein kinase
VRVARDKKTDKFVAVKIMKKAEIIKMKQVDHIMNENNILASIDHPFIITMEGFT